MLRDVHDFSYAEIAATVQPPKVLSADASRGPDGSSQKGCNHGVESGSATSASADKSSADSSVARHPHFPGSERTAARSPARRRPRGRRRGDRRRERPHHTHRGHPLGGEDRRSTSSWRTSVTSDQSHLVRAAGPTIGRIDPSVISTSPSRPSKEPPPPGRRASRRESAPPVRRPSASTCKIRPPDRRHP